MESRGSPSLKLARSVLKGMNEVLWMEALGEQPRLEIAAGGTEDGTVRRH